MEAHSAFELEVLSRVADDYAAPDRIAEAIWEETGRPTSEAEVRRTLLLLAQTGLVQAYVYDESWRIYDPHGYEPVSDAEASVAADAWFMATTAGRAEIARHAH